MKITAFNPMIVTQHAEEVTALFEALGFERRHHKIAKLEDGEQGLDFSTVRMKDANGFHVDVCAAEYERLARDMTVIRMNVDDFDEATELLKSHGFRESKVAPQNETPTSRYACYVSPSGFVIDVIKHIRKAEE